MQTHPCAGFRSVFARSTSAVTLSKKVQLRLIGSPLSASNEPTMNIISLRCPQAPRWWLKNAVSKITDRKSHTAFDWNRPRWHWMTLNCIIAFIFAFFVSPNSVALLANHTGWRLTYHVGKILSPIPVFHFWLKLTHPAARSLCW